MKELINWIKESEGVQSIFALSFLLLFVLPLTILFCGSALRAVGLK